MHADQAAPPAAGPGPGAPPRAGLSLWRIVDVPFRTCVAALETWPHTGRDGWPVVCGPVEHDPDSGTCRVQARLARGPLRRALPMRLQADHWSSAPAHRAGTHALQARPAQRRLLPGRPPVAGPAGPLAGTALAGAGPGR